MIDVSYRIMMKVARHVQSTPERKFFKLNNMLRKSIATAFVLYCDAKHSNTLLDSSHVCCYLFLGDCSQKWAGPFRS